VKPKLKRDKCGPGYQTSRREELEEPGIKWGRMEETSEEGRGPHRTVELLLLMIQWAEQQRFYA
jgi:hypothetical protein